MATEMGSSLQFPEEVAYKWPPY